MSDDLIKRSDAIKAVSKVDDYGDGIGFEVRSHCLVELELVPSADRPQGEWIPCKDKLPKNDDWKIITILDEHGDIPYRYSDFGWYFDNAKCWIVDAEPRTDVLAWMPLPKPWKGADDETD